MSRKIMTLEELLKVTPDGVLLDIQNELLENVVPASGYAHKFCRTVNKMIDKGELCINPTTYRKIYLPTLAKAVQKEFARRYTMVLMTGVAKPDESYEQLTLQFGGQKWV